MIITIDGTSGSGKSTVARALAKMIDFNCIKTGDMFRALAWKIIKSNIKPEETNKVIKLVKNTKIKFNITHPDNKIISYDFRITIDGTDVQDDLNSLEIISVASKIAVIPEVRKILLEFQRGIAEEGDFVFEGRDMGTVVFPKAKWKFYLNAEEGKRRERLSRILQRDITTDEIKEIDKRDMNRKIAPLKIAKDSIYYDNTLSPTPEQDATVLWYYLTHKEEIIKNAKMLVQ